MHAQVDPHSSILTPVPFTTVYLNLASVPLLNLLGCFFATRLEFLAWSVGPRSRVGILTRTACPGDRSLSPGYFFELWGPLLPSSSDSPVIYGPPCPTHKSLGTLPDTAVTWSEAHGSCSSGSLSAMGPDGIGAPPLQRSLSSRGCDCPHPPGHTLFSGRVATQAQIFLCSKPILLAMHCQPTVCHFSKCMPGPTLAFCHLSPHS